MNPRGASNEETKYLMQYGMKIFTNFIGICAKKVLKPPYKQPVPSADEIANFNNCMIKHMEIMETMKNNTRTSDDF